PLDRGEPERERARQERLDPGGGEARRGRPRRLDGEIGHDVGHRTRGASQPWGPRRGGGGSVEARATRRRPGERCRGSAPSAGSTRSASSWGWLNGPRWLWWGRKTYLASGSRAAIASQRPDGCCSSVKPVTTVTGVVTSG